MRDLPPLVVAATLAVVAAGCAGAAHSKQTKSELASAPSHVRNPFTIVARYSAASLGLRQPLDLAIGPDGNLYVTDAADRVTVVSPAGKVLRRWGRNGTAQGEFHFVGTDPNAPPNELHASIAIGPDGKVYVSDSGNYRVEVFSSTGRFIRSFGSFGLHNGQFQAPGHLAADGAGDVYVADDQAETLSKFSAAGRFQWSLGGSGTTDPDLIGHFDSLSIDPHNRVISVNGDSHAVVYLDAAGHKVDAFSTRGDFLNDWGPCDVSVDGQGDTVVESCPDAGQPVPGVPAYRATLLFDRTHRLVGAWYGSPFSDFVGPRFGPHGEIFAIGADPHTASPESPILRLKVALPGA